MKLKKFFCNFLFLIFFIAPASLLAGLIAGTTIKSPQSNICIESLKKGAEVCSYDIEKKYLSSAIVKKIIPSNIFSLYTITTKRGTIQTSADQLLFELKRHEFIQAQDLQSGDYLLTNELEALECLSINQIHE